jgi:YD repeat-containing protein
VLRSARSIQPLGAWATRDTAASTENAGMATLRFTYIAWGRTVKERRTAINGRVNVNILPAKLDVLAL